MNTPVYDAKGRRVALAETWRIPRRPFARPSCCQRGTTRAIGWNLYRCTICAARIEPERLWHRLLFTRNPFGSSTVRALFRVTRWTHRFKATWGAM